MVHATHGLLHTPQMLSITSQELESGKQPTHYRLNTETGAVKRFALRHTTVLGVHFLVKAGLCSEIVDGVEQGRVSGYQLGKL